MRFVETDVDLAKMVLQYTKAVAERPYKSVQYIAELLVYFTELVC